MTLKSKKEFLGTPRAILTKKFSTVQESLTMLCFMTLCIRLGTGDQGRRVHKHCHCIFRQNL